MAEKTLVEFFAGIGLVREALSAGGWHCIYANDLNPKKQEIYAARFPECGEFHLEDVWNTREVATRISDRPFLATASFPCTDLSLAGHWKGLSGRHSSAFFGFLRVLEHLGDRRPHVVLLENVVGLLTSRNGEDFATVVLNLADLGYCIDAFVLDAKYFVPQSRKRVFVIAVDRELSTLFRRRQPPSTLFDDSPESHLTAGPLRPQSLVNLFRSIELPTSWLGLELSVPQQARYSLKDFIDVDPDQEWWDEAAVTKHYWMMSDRHRGLVDELLVRGETLISTIFRRKRHGKTRSEVRFDGLAGCLRTPRGGSARQIVIVVESGKLRMRWMSPIEYARLQGADRYPMLSNVYQMLYGFGDAVCVPAIAWIDQMLLTPLFKCAQEACESEVAIA